MEARNWVELLQFFVKRVKDMPDYVEGPPVVFQPDGSASGLKWSQLWLHMMYKTVQRKHLTEFYWTQIVSLDEEGRRREDRKRPIRLATNEERTVFERMDQGISDRVCSALEALGLRQVEGAHLEPLVQWQWQSASPWNSSTEDSFRPYSDHNRDELEQAFRDNQDDCMVRLPGGTVYQVRDLQTPYRETGPTSEGPTQYAQDTPWRMRRVRRVELKSR
uniref:WWE domain-containing protein n=1 Tax=Prymnesium polylepis TaxID=72548 RepID=A0A6T7ZZH0_9EUKA|mmetsp:Transcript_12029/g.31586  ORF Transcript_12029/g.31586 Transcript_12029/m.31586 type:complete len:219 (-) Transcript_12029:499-1155(-)|eukprot:6067989-Prymnesium_polylepis.2